MSIEVLLIDPDNVSRTLIKYHLKRAGYIVHEAANCEAALRFSPYVRPSLIIADESVNLEEQPSGQIKCYTALPWVVLTDLPAPQRTESRRTYLAKPALSSQLLRCIDALMTSC
ncbi:MAG: response regulator [Herpetosiphonaceae bacterium]|nr:response regulator [Herpetosiphonaceae bacterium]